MAEPTNKPKTISFAGRNIDQNEFNRRARQKAAEWAQYQGLKGDEIADFNESLNDILAGISDGRYTITETGALSGKGPSSVGSYNSKTGQRIDDTNGGNSRRRRGFDPNSNVMGYLNGIAGAMNEGAAKSTSSSSSSKKSSSLEQYISDAIFGEGNQFSSEQLMKWADAYDAVGADGKRGVAGRRQFIEGLLTDYKTKLENGEFDGMSDEQSAKELDAINTILGNPNADPEKDWQLSKVAPWMSHLLFTDSKYYSDPSARQADEAAAETSARERAVEAYLNGVEGATNPYDQGSEEYNLLEQRKRERDDQVFDEDFRTHRWDYADAGQSFRTQVTDGLDAGVFSGWNPQNVRDYLAGAEGLQTNELGQDVHAGTFGGYHGDFGRRMMAQSVTPWSWTHQFMFGNEFGHENYTGWGKSDQSLKDSGLQNYFDALPNDFKPDDTTMNFGKNARSNKAILGKAAVDYARSLIAQGGENYQLADGSYILPQFIDWNTGKAYKFVLNGNKATVVTANIGDVINGLNQQSPLYKTLLNEWRYHNQRPAYNKEGGVLYAKRGTPLSEKEVAMLTGQQGGVQSAPADPRYATNYQPLATAPYVNPAADQLAADQARYAEAQANGAAKQRRVDEGNKTLSEGWSGVDIARASAIVADLGSIGAAFIPGYGTAAAGVLGVGSTLTTLGADFADKGVSTGQALGGLALNLGMDLASLIPGINVSAGGMKVTKNILKIAPKLIPAFTALATGPEAIETIKKISSNGLGSITKEELRNLSYCISAVTGMGHVGISAGKRAQMAKSAPKGSTETVKSFKYKNAAGETVEIANPETSVASIKEAGKNGQDAALAKLREITGDPNAEFATGESFKKILGVEVGKKPKVKTSTNQTEHSEAYLKWLESHRSADEARRRQWIAEGNAPDAGVVGKAKKFMAKNLSTNFEIMQGGASYLANPILRGKAGNHGAYRQHIKDEIAGTEGKVMPSLDNTGAAEAFTPTVTARTTAAQTELNNATTARNNFFKTEAEAAGAARTAHENAKTAEAAAESTLNESLKKVRVIGKKKASKADKITDVKAYGDNLNAANAEQARLAEEFKKLSRSLERTKDATKKADIQSKLDATKKDLDDITASIKSLTQDKQAARYQKALEAIRGHEAAQIKTADTRTALLDAVSALRTKMGSDEAKPILEAVHAARKKVNGPAAKDYSEYASIASTLGIKLEGATPNIKAKREENFKTFIEFLKSQGQNDTQIRGILNDKAFMGEARKSFKFAEGGILKANVGLQIPVPQKPTPQTPATPITGTLGNGSNGPLSGTLGGNSGISGTLGTSSSANPTNPTGGNISGIINPSVRPGAPGEIGWGVNPTDLAITALESGKYGLTQGMNGAIFNLYSSFKGFHETPLAEHYRQWSAKPLEDQIAKNFAEYRRLGARAAAGTTDQNQAFAHQLAATDRAMAANVPLALQANEQIKTTVDQQNAVGNKNFANMHEVGERNRQGDVALSNARLKAYADYLHKFGTTAAQNIMARQYGMAKAGIANDERAFQAAINTDPTVTALRARYEDVARRRAIDPNSVSDAEVREATLNYREAASRFKDNWVATHIVTTGTPYSGYGYIYQAPATFDFGSGFVGFARRGGKMEAAEREKTRREYEKIYHDSMKLLITESNKKLRSGNAYAFYRKLFMHAK